MRSHLVVNRIVIIASVASHVCAMKDILSRPIIERANKVSSLYIYYHQLRPGYPIVFMFKELLW